jgi:signal transduction histidine kinase
MRFDEAKVRKIGQIAAATVCAGGLTIIAGWQFRIPVLRGEVLDTFVAPNTALLILICGISILLQSSNQKPLQAVGAALSVPVFAGGMMVLLERITGVDFGLDRIFMAHRLSDWTVIPHVGRFSVVTALNFTFAGLALATLRVERKVLPDAFVGFIAMLVYFAIVGYIYQTSILYGRVTSSSTIALFAILALALWCSSSSLQFIRYFTGSSAGSITARRVVLSILVLLPALGFLEIEGRQINAFGREEGMAFFVVATATIFTALVLQTATVLDQIDRRRKNAEAGLIQTEKLAATGRMAATIAHEINNPLGAVTNLIYLCRTLDLDAATRDSYLAMAEEEVKHLALISKQTLGFYRETAEPTAINLEEMVGQVIALYRSRLANKGIDLRQSLHSGARVFGIGGELRQVLVNLVSNAFDACPNTNGIIRIASAVEHGRVVIDVSDNGHGVKDSDRDRIFDAFFTTKEKIGTGLGLWVSKGLIEKNGGTIRLISNDIPFRTTFRLTMPAVMASDQRSRA